MTVPFAAAAVARLDEKQQRAERQNGHSPRKRGSLMRILLSAFPLFVIPVGIYALIALAQGAPAVTAVDGATAAQVLSPMMAILGGTLFSVPMISGDLVWIMTNGDALVVLSIAVLFMEILKSTSTGTATIMNHALSMIVFIVCLMLFLLHPNFATSVFFILTVMALLDVLAGVVVTIVSARRDFGVAEGFVG